MKGLEVRENLCNSWLEKHRSHMFLKNLFFDKLSGLGRVLRLRQSFVHPSAIFRGLSAVRRFRGKSFLDDILIKF